MLANNNRSVINKLAENTARTDKQQFLILFITILLSSFMLFSIFTIGLTYLDLSRLQNTRLYGSEYDIAIMNGFTEDQKKILIHHSGVKSVGVLAYCGNVKSSDSDRSVNAGFLWGDETYWESQKTPAITEMMGHYPQTQNELLATEEVLEACGKSALSVGDRLSLTYEDHTGIHAADFVISGIWKGYGGDKANFYVSKDFYEQTGYDPESDGILQVKFKSNYVTGFSGFRLHRKIADHIICSAGTVLYDLPQRLFADLQYPLSVSFRKDPLLWPAADAGHDQKAISSTDP